LLQHIFHPDGALFENLRIRLPGIGDAQGTDVQVRAELRSR
jgi:hypothetical protein